MRWYIAAGAAITATLTVVAAISSETISYIYDANGRLIKVERAVTVNNTVKTEYVQDKADNRKNVKVTGSPNPPPP